MAEEPAVRPDITDRAAAPLSPLGDVERTPRTALAPQGGEVVIETGPGAGAERKRRGLTERQNRIVGLLSPVILLIGWELAVAVGITDGRFFPPPSAIAGTFWEMVTSGEVFYGSGLSASAGSSVASCSVPSPGSSSV